MKNIVLITAFVALTAGACAQESAAPVAGDVDGAGELDVAALVDAADAEAGKRQFIFCQACHTTRQGDTHKVGPNLAGIFGKSAATADGFKYSEALAESGIVWNDATIDKWIASPAALVPGTSMVFAGIPDPEQRADLIAYLQKVTSGPE